ncbi:MAG: AAA family ATPase [Deltaproteobacteria bacterium]|nr:AAA family ATPase [Deltaproteobacteria bacterium]
MANAITRVEIKDFLAFKGEFALDFCPGVNVLIGGNGTGKTTLMKAMYSLNPKSGTSAREILPALNLKDGDYGKLFITGSVDNFIYIPEKDMLEHAKGLLTFIERKQTGFSAIYKDVLVSAMDTPPRELTATQKSIGEKIVKIIGGAVYWDNGASSFFTMGIDGSQIPLAYESSGFKKLGYLGLLVASGQIQSGSVLFWDEPENSLNPDLTPELVDILLELCRCGVQIFIATHSYDIARWFELNIRAGDSLRYFNLRKTDGKIVADVADDYISLPNNVIEDAGDRLLKRVAEVAAVNAGVKLK